VPGVTRTQRITTCTTSGWVCTARYAAAYVVSGDFLMDEILSQYGDELSVAASPER
jgi:hypothetical protein